MRLPPFADTAYSSASLTRTARNAAIAVTVLVYLSAPVWLDAYHNTLLYAHENAVFDGTPRGDSVAKWLFFYPSSPVCASENITSVNGNLFSRGNDMHSAEAAESCFRDFRLRMLAVPQRCGLCVLLWPAVHFQVMYYDFYTHVAAPVAANRMGEAYTAVVSFFIASQLFTWVRAAGVRKMRGTLRPAGGPAEDEHTDRDGDTINAVFRRGVLNFLFWAVLNIGIYILAVEVLHLAAGRELADTAVIQLPDYDPPMLLRLAAEVLCSVAAYDFIFYFIHRSFHRCLSGARGAQTPAQAPPSMLFGLLPAPSAWYPRQLARWWGGLHLLHHDHYRTGAEPLHALVTFHHHLYDAALQVVINIIVQQLPLGLYLLAVNTNAAAVLPAWCGPLLPSAPLVSFSLPLYRHMLSKLAHNVAVTYLLVESHSGFDLPWMSHRLFPAVFGGAPRHQVHHAVGTCYFHQFFMYLDDFVFAK